jgi:glycosyltransferase involved in cell wall biosynthesis
MLCYHFPPVSSSGTTRNLAFARRLAEFAWTPLVLTVSTARDRWVHSGGEIPVDIDIARSFEWDLTGLVDLCHGVANRIARIFGGELERNVFRELLCFPDAQIAWFSTPKGLCLARQCDCIYASCSPFSSALSSCWIKLLSGKPLVLDFRDAWSFNPHREFRSLEFAATRWLERRVLDIADHLVVNTEGAARLYRSAYPRVASRISVIPNGYDELGPAPRATARTDGFTIMHIGTFYGNRRPDGLLEALSRIGDPSIEFVQVGAPCDALEHYSGSVPIRYLGPMRREDALETMRSASLLYLKQGFEPGERDYIAVGAKTYEYLATGLPILADCPPGDNAETVARYCAHPYVVTTNRVEDIVEAILSARRASPQLEPRVTDEFVRTFDRRVLTARLAGVLDEVTSARRAVNGIGRSPVDRS